MSIQSNAPLTNVESNLSADGMPSGIDAAKIGAGAVSNTEFGYLDGVTSALQTQLDNKGKLIIHALRITSNQTGLSGSHALNTVILNSIPTNLGGYFTESSGIWTCVVACTVRIRAQIYQVTTSAGQTLGIYKDSTAEAVGQPAPGATPASALSAEKVIGFTAGQTFKLTIQAASAPAVGAGDGLSWLQVTLETA